MVKSTGIVSCGFSLSTPFFGLFVLFSHCLLSYILSVNMSEVNTLQNPLSWWLNRGNVISIWAVESQTMSHLIWSFGDTNGTFVSQPQGAQNTSSHFATLYNLVKKHELKQQQFLISNLLRSQPASCPHVPAFTLWFPPPCVAPVWLAPPRVQPMPQYSPCHSPFQCLYSHGPHIVAWVLGEHGLSPPSCHCAPQCQTPSGKGPGPRPCCYFWPEQETVKGRWWN